MCLVFTGKAFPLTQIVMGCPQEPGYDSHTSPDGCAEVVIFDEDQILPVSNLFTPLLTIVKDVQNQIHNQLNSFTFSRFLRLKDGFSNTITIKYIKLKYVYFFKICLVRFFAKYVLLSEPLQLQHQFSKVILLSVSVD